MNKQPGPAINDGWIESLRGKKNPVSENEPYGWLVEKELTAGGKVEDVGIIFLTNRECPYRCLMCDLWKNTTDGTVSPGSITGQIELALRKIPGIKHIKLYNSGSFIDERAIPEAEYEPIAKLLEGFETVIVESHPRLIGDRCLRFSRMLKPQLEVALGLETANPDLLKRLNKKMTPADFTSAVDFLHKNNIRSRAFILLRPPFLSEEEGVSWAEKSLDFAFGAGVQCCTVIPVRGGNGAMELLKEQGLFSPPSLKSLEKVIDYGIGLKAGRVFADLWDIELFSDCPECTSMRKERLNRINLTQAVQPPVDCTCT
jgi:archaeosine synthase beta-subunit